MTINGTEIVESIEADVPRVVDVAEASAGTDGFGRTLRLKLRTSTTDPLSGEELEAVLRAVWRTANYHPADVSITARDAATGETTVDVRAAARGSLPEDRYIEFGDGGVSVYGLEEIFGPWPH